jgi:hypothetical protein
MLSSWLPEVTVPWRDRRIAHPTWRSRKLTTLLLRADLSVAVSTASTILNASSAAVVPITQRAHNRMASTICARLHGALLGLHALTARSHVQYEKVPGRG